MEKLVLDYETLAKLRAATVLPCKVYDPAGNLVAYLTPAPTPDNPFPEFPGLTVEQLDRELADPNTKWYTPDEVMARINSLRKAP